MTDTKYILTDEEKRKIEEHRGKALLLRANAANKRANEQQISAHLIHRNEENKSGNGGQNKLIVENEKLIQPVQSSKQHYRQTPYNQNKLTGNCTLISKQRFMIDIGYHQKVIDLLKTYSSRVYDASSKKWSINVNDHDKLMKDMQNLKGEISLLPLPSYVKIFANLDSDQINSNVDVSSLGSEFLQSLYPFQVDGIRFVISKNGRAMIADDMGLGKTVQALGVAAFYREDWPLLVISPSSMRYSWLEAIKRWIPSLKSQEIIVADNNKNHFGKVTALIMSYDLLTRKADYMKMRNFGVVIVDESHFMKNYKTSRTQAILPILKQAKRVVLLSGTPALSRPFELCTQIFSLNSTIFPSFHEFGLRYCGGKKMAWGWDYSGATNMTELQCVLEGTVLIRRLKSDVMRDLPSKQREMVVLDPDKIDHHKSMKSAAGKWVDNGLKGVEKRGALLQYFHETGSAKMRAVSEYVVDQVESGKKFLCFVHHDTVMNCVCDHLDKKKVQHIRIDGKTPSQERKELCDKFQYSDVCRVAILSITAANMGLTLTAAQLVVFGELFWNPGILTQAEDRAHRIGQTCSVVVQYLVAKNTADDYLWPLVQKKLDILNKAGLSKDNFKNANLKIMEKSKQRTLDVDFDWLEDLDETDDEPSIKKLKS